MGFLAQQVHKKKIYMCKYIYIYDTEILYYIEGSEKWVSLKCFNYFVVSTLFLQNSYYNIKNKVKISYKMHYD